MFTLKKEFHLLHVVEDLDAADAWYDDVFAVRRFVRNTMKAAMRRASLVLIGDFVMEPAQPLQRFEGWERSALGKFYSRCGQHFHSIAWYVDDLNATCAHLSKCGIRLFDMVGNIVTRPSPRDGAVWTHPQDTHAAFEFAAIPKFFIDPRLQPGWSTTFSRDEHPLGVERASHITMLFRNLKDARAVYETALGGKQIHEEHTADAHRVFYAVGEDTVIEAVQQKSAASAAAKEFARYGEGIYALTFKTKNLRRAAEHLRAKGLHISEDANGITIDRNDAFGMVLRFSEMPIPNDPRHS